LPLSTIWNCSDSVVYFVFHAFPLHEPIISELLLTQFHKDNQPPAVFFKPICDS